jgi:hypothetical protein
MSSVLIIVLCSGCSGVGKPVTTQV